MDLVKVRHKETGSTYGAERHYVDEAEETIVGGPEDLTAAEIAEVLSADAENDNYHEFVGFFEKLGAIVAKHAGPEAAAKIMLEVAQGGGYSL